MRTSALSCKAPWTRWRISAASPSSGDVSHRRTNSASTARTDRIGRRNMKRLNGIDAMLLYSETPNLHTHTLKVAVIDPSDFDGDFGFDVFRHDVRRRLHLLEPLRYKLVDIPWQLHHPMWQENCEVDLNYHLRRLRVPAPGARRCHRRDRLHAAGSQPPAVGISLRRGAGR